MHTLNQLKNIFSNITCLYFQEASNASVEKPAEKSDSKPEDYDELSKKYSGNIVTYLKGKISKDPEILKDPEATPTLELLKRHINKINEADNNLKEKLKTITNFEFLGLPEDERLQYVTEEGVDYKNVASWDTKEITFFFDQDWNGKDDTDLYRMTTIGQVLWKEVSSVKSWGEVYTREWIDWEFFNWNNRLVIHTGTQVSIENLRTPEELNTLQEWLNKDFEKYKDSPNADIVKEALERWIEPEFALLAFSEALEWIEGSSRKIKIEEMFTQFDRVRDNIPDWDWKLSRDGKYPEELVIKLLKEYNNNWELKANEYWINNEKIKQVEAQVFERFKGVDITNLPKWVNWLLEFISIAEWTNWNYNSIYWNWEQHEIDFTDMTLREVFAYQKSYKMKKWSAAIWKYQLMDYTIKDLVNQYSISLDEKFSPELQDRLAICRLKKRWLDAYISWWIDKDRFQLKLSQEWASLPKDDTGKSYYQGDWLNKALVSSGQVDNILDNLKASV